MQFSNFQLHENPFTWNHYCLWLKGILARIFSIFLSDLEKFQFWKFHKMPLSSYEFRKNQWGKSITCLGATGILPTFSIFFVCFAYSTVQKMYTNLYQASEQGFHENRHRGSRTFLTEIKRASTMKPNDVYKAKNASTKSVCLHGMHHFQYSC